MIHTWIVELQHKETKVLSVEAVKAETEEEAKFQAVTWKNIPYMWTPTGNILVDVHG